MPVLDGVSADAEIRRREAERGTHLPIVAMTAHALKGDRERYLAAGMDGYVSKPIHTHDLYAAIEAAVAGTKPRDPDPVSAEAAPNEEPTPAAGGDALAIDWNAAVQHTAGDEELMQKMIDVFLAECPKMLDEARAALAAQDGPRLRRAGHSLKGSCGYFAAPPAYEAAFAIERLGQAGDFSAARQAMEELNCQLGRLRTALVKFQGSP